MDEITKIENLLIQIGAINKSYEKIAKLTGENFNIFDTNKILVKKFENQLSQFSTDKLDLSENEQSDLIENELKKLGYV